MSRMALTEHTLAQARQVFPTLRVALFDSWGERVTGWHSVGEHGEVSIRYAGERRVVGLGIASTSDSDDVRLVPDWLTTLSDGDTYEDRIGFGS